MSAELDLSQDDINNLLNELVPPATALSPELESGTTELCSIALSTAIGQLSSLIGKSLTIQKSPDFEVYETQGPEIFAGEAKYLIRIPYNIAPETHTSFILKTTDALRVLGWLMETEATEMDAAGLQNLNETFASMSAAAVGSLQALSGAAFDLQNSETQEYTPEIFAALYPKNYAQLKFEVEAEGLAEPIQLVQVWSVAEIQTHVQAFMKPPGKSAEPTPQAPAAAPPPSGVTVQQVQFAPFDQNPAVFGETNKNLDLVLDIKLNMTVELGKTEISIKEVLEMTRGSVIELDRIAGEPVDLLANGKLIAKGEVVVIEDNFGLRITSIVSPAERLKGLQ